MEFIGREPKLARIGRVLARDVQQNVLVYGRRRVGKSALIKRALEQRGAEATIYFECQETSEWDNVASLAALAAEALGFPPLAIGGVPALQDVLFEQVQSKDVVLVLDEYPYLRDAVKGLGSIVQTSIDRWRESSRMKIVLCGSCVEVMRSLLEASSPLYGRMDLARELGWRTRFPCTSGPRFQRSSTPTRCLGRFRRAILAGVTYLTSRTSQAARQ